MKLGVIEMDGTTNRLSAVTMASLAACSEINVLTLVKRSQRGVVATNSPGSAVKSVITVWPTAGSVNCNPDKSPAPSATEISRTESTNCGKSVSNGAVLTP